MMHRKQDRNDHIRMELRRLLNSVVLVPAMVIRRARSSTVRTIGDNPGPDRLLSTWSTIERTRFGRPRPNPPHPAQHQRGRAPPTTTGGDHPCPHHASPRRPQPPGRQRAAP